jgi:hypothetical protein
MTRCETPAFDPGIAFSWTLRSAEIASRPRQLPQDPQPDRTKLENTRRDVAQVAAQAARYETPTFEPGIAFSWTLRSAEIARLQSPQPLDSKPDPTRPHVLVAA